MKKISALLGVAVLTLSSITGAQAHSSVVKTVPQYQSLLQELPSQVSINVSTPSTEPVEPTATHHEVDTHDTDDKELSPVSALGLGTIVSVSIAASAGVGITTEPSKSAETTTTLDSHIRIIRNSQRNVRLDLGKRYSNATTTRVFF